MDLPAASLGRRGVPHLVERLDHGKDQVEDGEVIDRQHPVERTRVRDCPVSNPVT